MGDAGGSLFLQDPFALAGGSPSALAHHTHVENIDILNPSDPFAEFLGQAESPLASRDSISVSPQQETPQQERYMPGLQSPGMTHGSLEALPGAFSFYIGPTGSADVHLLSREEIGRAHV